jgi:hypothetical protein
MVSPSLEHPFLQAGGQEDRMIFRFTQVSSPGDWIEQAALSEMITKYPIVDDFHIIGLIPVLEIDFLSRAIPLADGARISQPG